MAVVQQFFHRVCLALFCEEYRERWGDAQPEA